MNATIQNDLGASLRSAISLSRECGYDEVTVYQLQRPSSYIAQETTDDPPVGGRPLCIVVAALDEAALLA
jgi:hypothetical protein